STGQRGGALSLGKTLLQLGNRNLERAIDKSLDLHLVRGRIDLRNVSVVANVETFDRRDELVVQDRQRRLGVERVLLPDNQFLRASLRCDDTSKRTRRRDD